MDYKKLADDLLSYCHLNCSACEYAGDALECTIKQLASTAITDLLARAEAAEDFLKKLLKSMDELKREYEVAVQDLEMIMFKGKENIDTCAYCRNARCYVRGGRDCCNPIWRGRDKIEVAGNF